MIQFIECQTPGYKARTLENATADITIAIAKDFRTAGEYCTRNAVYFHRKLYESVLYDNLTAEKALWIGTTALHVKSVNIAGNGIYTFAQFGISQEMIDMKVYHFLSDVFGYSNTPQLIRSGGQTGIDEAALKAAVKLGIPALCLAAKGWMFRDINQKDIADEQLFKARFNP